MSTSETALAVLAGGNANHQRIAAVSFASKLGQLASFRQLRLLRLACFICLPNYARRRLQRR